LFFIIFLSNTLKIRLPEQQPSPQSAHDNRQNLLHFPLILPPLPATRLTKISQAFGFRWFFILGITIASITTSRANLPTTSTSNNLSQGETNA